jgi:hypothetical protein
MSRASISISGLDKLKKKIGGLPENVAQQTDALMSSIANEFVNRAQNDAPQDNRFLANHITHATIGLMDHEVVSPAPYSAYVEFGTKKRFKAIPGIDSSKYMGKGSGDYYDFLNAILDWVKRKGLHHVTNSYTGKKVGGKAAKENLVVLAEAIAWSIIKNGIHPHPFFFRQMPIAQADFNKRFSQVFKQAINK